MALLEDIEPPSNGGKKIKNLSKIFSKYQNYLKCNIPKGLNGFKKAFFRFGDRIRRYHPKQLFYTLKNKTNDTVRTIKRKSQVKISQIAESEALDPKIPVKDKVLKFFKVLISHKQNFAHLAIIIIGAIVFISNLFVYSARSKIHSLVMAEPVDEINLSYIVDRYTPLIEGDGKQVESSFENSSDSFWDVKVTLATAYTEREEPLPDNSGSSVNYIVRSGDNLITLAMKFNVSSSALMYYNFDNLNNLDYIKPGQKLKIPPKGSDISASKLAQKKKEKEQTRLASTRKTSYSSSSSSYQSGPAVVSHQDGSRSNGYPYGYCTYYVATRRYVPTSWGNAKYWLNSAARSGYKTGSTPAVGAVVVTGESWAGHVGYVEKVSGNTITIAEMNYSGWGVINRRTLPANGGAVRGYVY